MESRGPDPLPGLRADLLRGDAAYRRDESDDLRESGHALRAKAERLRRHFLELQEASAALKAESEQLRQQFQRQQPRKGDRARPVDMDAAARSGTKRKSRRPSR